MASKNKDSKYVVGLLSVNAKGFGFVTPDIKKSDKDSDIFIAPNKMEGALNGDRVKVKIIPPRNYYEKYIRQKREGRIVSVIEHVNKIVVGTYKVEYEFCYVESDDVRITQKVFVQNAKDFKDLQSGMKVVVEITKYPTAYEPMYGMISEILGKKREPGVDILAIIRRFNVTEEFPPEVLEEAARIETEPSEEEKSRRVSRKNFKIVTIDGEDAKDLDDGVYAKNLPDGGYFLGVYIADVSHYVKAASALDREAFERGTSIYPVDRVVPMLPKKLSNGICSLNAGVDRLSMACEMKLDSKGHVIKYEILQTVIRVHKRLTYTAVNKFFSPNIGDVSTLKDIAPMLEVLKKICELRQEIRRERGAIDFDIQELKVVLNDKGQPVDLIKRERNLAESIIEECMLVANETVAKHMSKLRMPFIYRVHEQPESEKIDKFNDLLATFNLHVNKKPNGSIRPMDIQKVLNKVKGKREEKIISTVALRSMQQAHYSAENSGHFGLAAEFYTHFTSPIRRYPDLIVHRLLRELAINKNRNPKRLNKIKKELPKIATHSSTRERLAVDIERETTDLKAVEYMTKFVGKIFSSVISSVTHFGFFVELENGVEGLVRIGSLFGDYFNFIEAEYVIIGQNTGKTFKIGDEVRVKLVEANIQLRQLTFMFVGRIIEPEEIIVTD